MHFLKTRSRIDTLPERQLAIKRLECNQNISTRPKPKPRGAAHVRARVIEQSLLEWILRREGATGTQFSAHQRY